MNIRGQFPTDCVTLWVGNKKPSNRFQSRMPSLAMGHPAKLLYAALSPAFEMTYAAGLCF